jgi:hypothetical protein
MINQRGGTYGDNGANLTTDTRKLGIVGWLTGDGIPCPTVGKFSNSIRVFATNLCRSLELHEAAQRIASKLSK